MEIHLIRHGKTFANEKRLYCGQTDLPISEKGAEEIKGLKSQGIYPAAADVFFTSGLLRCEQTIDIIYGKTDKTDRIDKINKTDKIDKTDKKTIPDIAEFKFGLFEMKSYDELKGQADYQAWITDETGDFQCPQGESKKQFERRVIGGFNRILNDVRKTACESAFVVCHGGTIACIMEYLYPDIKNFYEWQPKPGRGYTLVYISGKLHIYSHI